MAFKNWPRFSKERNRDAGVSRKLDPDTIAKLPVEALLKLDSQTLNQLPTEVLCRLPAEELLRLSGSTLARLPPERLGQLPWEGIRKLPRQTLVALTPSALANIPTRYLCNLPTAVLLQFPPDSFAKASPDELECLPSEVLGRLEGLSPDILNALSANTLCHLSPSVLALVAPERLRFLPVDVLSKLPVKALGKLPPETLALLPTTTLLTLPPEMLLTLDSNALSRLPWTVRQQILPNPAQSAGPSRRPDWPALSDTTQVDFEDGGLSKPPPEEHEHTKVAEGVVSETGRSSVSMASDQPRYQTPTNSEMQLQESLRLREQLLSQFETALDEEIKKARSLDVLHKEALWRYEEQRNDYEKQLADLHNLLAQEKAEADQLSRSHEDELAKQKSSHLALMKQLEQDLKADNSAHVKSLKEEQQKSDAELNKTKQVLHQAKAHYAIQLESQRRDAMARAASKERELSRKLTEHVDRLEALEKEHTAQSRSLTEKLDNQAIAHEHQVDILNNQLQEQDANYRSEIAQLAETHTHKLQSSTENHQRELTAYKAKFNAHTESLRRQYEDRLQMERDSHQRELHLMTDRHRNALQQQVLEHNRVLDSLRAQSGDYIRPVSDDKLKGMFRQLKIAIEVVSEPFNLGRVAIQPGSPLDPTGFLQREKGMQRHLLRSLVWARIAHGFFSAPFGFGAFGDGPGKQMLLELLLQWRRLFAVQGTKHPSAQLVQTSGAQLDIHSLCQDRETNRWRSATFQSIMAIVTASGTFSADGETGEPAAGSPFSLNCESVRNEILAVLREATGGQVASEIEEKVYEVTCIAGELALEMGVQRAYAGLEFPDRGEQVNIGRDFVDCEDGDAAPGELGQVELVVCPRFFKIGDGRSDMTTSKSIFRGEIYPARR